MPRTNRFIWCSLHQQRRVLGSCPKCPRFPCKQISPEHIASIAAETPLVQALSGIIKRRIATMFFLVKTDRSLVPYHDTLDNLTAEQAAEAEEALECTSYIVQELTWVPAGKEKKVKVPGGGKEILCVVESATGELGVEETDPAEPRADGIKLYPVNKRFVRQYVPVKVNLEKPEAAPTAAPAKSKAAPTTKGAAKRSGAG